MRAEPSHTKIHQGALAQQRDLAMTEALAMDVWRGDRLSLPRGAELIEVVGVHVQGLKGAPLTLPAFISAGGALGERV